MDKDTFKDKHVLVMGLGRFGGGVDSAVFAYNCGAKVTVTDLADENALREAIRQLSTCPGVEYHLGGHREQDFQSDSPADFIIVNPAVRPDDRFLQLAEKSDKTITSQIEIFFQLCPATIIGITGANGKSTTCALTMHLLGNGLGREEPGCKKKVWLSGNIGNRPLLCCLDEIKPEDLIVLEISSFQLEQLARIKYAPHISVITNLTPNHLDRHGTFQAYCDTKELIFRFQRPRGKERPVSIFNLQDAVTSDWFGRYKNEKDRRCIAFSTDDVPPQIAEGFKIPGMANLSNLAAALAVARCLGVSDEQAAHVIQDFEPLPHRLQFVADINGIRWYNDSKATTPPSAITAINAFSQPVIIIAGGYDKKLSFEQFGAEIAKKTKGVVLIGQTAHAIKNAILSAKPDYQTIKIADSMAQAVMLAGQLSKQGDVVVLSPACASYDMFENYQQRGDVFGKLVKQLAG